MLLMSLLTSSDMDRQARVTMYVDIFANCKIREESATWIRKESAKLAKLVAARNNVKNMLWDLSLLKEKEIDDMESVFLSWKTKTGENFSKYWESRQKMLLGERWESREGVGEMDYHMKLVERGGAEVAKKDFLRWRESGIAYEVTEDDKNIVDNMTIISGEGERAGYCGDIVTGPFLCLGLTQRYDWSVQEKGEGVGGSSLTLARLEDMMEKIDDWNFKERVRIIPLSTSATSKIPKVLKTKVKISTVWVGLTMTHLITEGFSDLVIDEGKMLLETPLYLLQMTKELLDSFKEKVVEIGENAGFKCDESDYDVCKKQCVKFTRINC